MEELKFTDGESLKKSGKLTEEEKRALREYATGLDYHEQIVVLRAIPTDIILDHLRNVFGEYANFKNEVLDSLRSLGVATGETGEKI